MEVLFIQTGGTIDKDYGQGNGIYNFTISEPAVKRILERAVPALQYRTVSLHKKDSQDLSEEDRRLIVETCQAAPEKYIVITHGTDTMHKTAQALKGLTDKVIVLTGSLIPERFAHSDADFNIGTAVGALNFAQNGVHIAMSGRVMPWNKLSKNPKTGQFSEITQN
jgi:L-asparaginase